MPEGLFGCASGVIRTRVGYAGGSKVNPTYYSLGDHTETVDIDYNPEQTDYCTLLSLFWKHHNPTSKCSRQYMSLILYHDEEQKRLAMETMKAEQKKRVSPISTSIVPFKVFYNAEDYHQKYLLQRHPFLINALDISPGDELIKSHVAARINGYIGGYGTMDQFEEEWEKWGITEKMADYIRQHM
ncbi:peptide methionine sulfoxide reductase [Panulirus ornatus]|uniref:peptide methionine sulfoxide reductase n=1 Tax=Panulirus ornatus TaxID=150431 RepID=UPI003A871185